MWVLSRKFGQSIQIDVQIQISVTNISGNRVKIWIEAPLHMRIVRGEINDFDGLPICPTTESELQTADCYYV